MSKSEKILGTDEAWESGKLGTDEKFARLVSEDVAKRIDDAAGLQMISIRLDKSLIESFKMLGEFHGIGYQPLMRDALKRFAEAEMKAIVSGMVQSQRKSHAQKAQSNQQPEEVSASPEHRRAA